MTAATCATQEPGQPLLRLAWEGYHITTADELYHTSWQMVEGETVLRSPLRGALRGVSEGNQTKPAKDALHLAHAFDLNSEMTLAELHVDRPALQSAQGLVDEAAYFKSISESPFGRFGEWVQNGEVTPRKPDVSR